MLMVRCLVIERMVSLSQPLHVIIWQIRWGPKYRQHTGGRIGEQKASFIQTKLKYTQKPRARANQNLIKKTKDKVATKKGFNKVQRNKKKTNKKKKHEEQKTETHHGETLGDTGEDAAGKDGVATQVNTGERRVASRGQTERTDKHMRENKDYIHTHRGGDQVQVERGGRRKGEGRKRKTMERIPKPSSHRTCITYRH